MARDRKEHDTPAPNPQQRDTANRSPALRTGYGHSSGDRNSRHAEQTWTHFDEKSGEERKDRPELPPRKSKH